MSGSDKTDKNVSKTNESEDKSNKSDLKQNSDHLSPEKTKLTVVDGKKLKIPKNVFVPTCQTISEEFICNNEISSRKSDGKRKRSEDQSIPGQNLKKPVRSSSLILFETRASFNSVPLL